MNKRKIINDPIYGLISFPFDLVYDLIDHPYFQRLRRISQMGLSTYVYPGATHSRFSHAIGALHLMTKAIQTLRDKNIKITDEEYLGACVAILLHDIGHGPFSHCLEGLIINKSHEQISLDIMHHLNKEFDGALDIGILIFKNKYPKRFLSQLVSSQLDVDRLDYLTRDSFYSGVAEGIIGYNRIISMMNVVQDELVIEEKGFYSVEKFLVSRQIMYWQVYLHKTSICAEQMLRSYIKRLKEVEEPLKKVLYNGKSVLLDLFNGNTLNNKDYLITFCNLDDIDVFQILKSTTDSADPILSFLSKSILNRKLFKVVLSHDKIESDLLNSVRLNTVKNFNISDNLSKYLILTGQESSKVYDNQEDEIKILEKNGQIKPISKYLDAMVNVSEITKYYLCYPN